MRFEYDDAFLAGRRETIERGFCYVARPREYELFDMGESRYDFIHLFVVNISWTRAESQSNTFDTLEDFALVGRFGEFRKLVEIEKPFKKDVSHVF